MVVGCKDYDFRELDQVKRTDLCQVLCFEEMKLEYGIVTFSPLPFAVLSPTFPPPPRPCLFDPRHSFPWNLYTAFSKYQFFIYLNFIVLSLDGLLVSWLVVRLFVRQLVGQSVGQSLVGSFIITIVCWLVG